MGNSICISKLHSITYYFKKYVKFMVREASLNTCILLFSQYEKSSKYFIILYAKYKTQHATALRAQFSKNYNAA